MSLNVARHLIKSSTATLASFRAGTSSLSRRSFHSTVPRGVLYSDADKEVGSCVDSGHSVLTIVECWCQNSDIQDHNFPKGQNNCRRFLCRVCPA